MTRKALLLCLLGVVLLGLFLASVKAGSAVLNEESPHVELEWEVLGDPTTTDPSEVDIEFTVTTDTTGWVGIGFALSAAMFPSDNIVMWVDDTTEEAHAEDRFSNDHTTPILDTSSGGTDDVELVSGEQTETGQTFIVRRKLETADTMHDHVIGPDPLYVLWAVGDSDDFEQHAAQGSVQLTLVGDEVSGSASASDSASASASVSESEESVEGSEVSSNSASERVNSDSLSSSTLEEDTTGGSSTTRAAGLISTALVALSAVLVAAL